MADVDEVLHGKPLVNKLNELIQLDFDAIVSYGHAIERCTEVEVRRDLERFRADHERHITELSNLIRQLGGQPIALHRDLKGLVLEGLTTLRSLGGTISLLRAMRTNERLTNRTYAAAADLAVALAARVVVDQNYADEKRHLKIIESHLDRFGGTAIVTPFHIAVDHDQPLRRF